jgi:hypothetical protein
VIFFQTYFEQRIVWEIITMQQRLLGDDNLTPPFFQKVARALACVDNGKPIHEKEDSELFRSLPFQKTFINALSPQARCLSLSIEWIGER